VGGKRAGSVYIHFSVWVQSGGPDVFIFRQDLSSNFKVSLFSLISYLCERPSLTIPSVGRGTVISRVASET
jgi:hypothetical protein